MHGRSAAQPRAGTHNCQLFKNCLRYLFEILTQYGRHVNPYVYQRKLNQLRDGAVISTDAHTHSPPTQTLFFTTDLSISYLNIYLSLYIALDLYIGANKIYKLTDIPLCTFYNI